jgi:hypothetical protein
MRLALWLGILTAILILWWLLSLQQADWQGSTHGFNNTASQAGDCFGMGKYRVAFLF